jgi:hypothetical protein
MAVHEGVPMKEMVRRGLFLVLTTTLWACGGGTDDVDPQQAVEDDIAQYESLQQKLEATREEFIKTPAQDFYAAGNTLYWVEVGSGNPLLRSFDDGAKKRTDYTFKVFLTGTSAPNPVDTINYHASSSTIATMNVLDGGNVYAAGFPEQLLGKLNLPAPSFGQRWWAYSVTAEDVFVVVIDSTSGKYMLQKWSLDTSTFTTLLALDDLISPNAIGEFLDFAVDGTTLIFAESGRIWMADLADGKAKWVQNDKEIGSANFYDGGVVYSQGAEFYRYDMATDTRENLTEKIQAGYSMNKTYSHAHYPDNNGSWCKHKNKIVYHGSSGIFAYDLTSEKVIPILLDARDNSVVYRHPTAVDTGTLFVKGLVSESGAIGADGPTFVIDASGLF